MAGLRVLLNRTTEELWSWSMATALQAAVIGGGWEIVISSATSPDVLARRQFRRRRDAQRARDEFVRLADLQQLGEADADQISRALGC